MAGFIVQLQVLEVEDAASAVALYDTIFLNVEFAAALWARPVTTIVNFIGKSLTVLPTWTSPKLARRLQQLTSLVYLSATAEHFNDVWLYSLSLVAACDPGEVVLADRQAELASALAVVCRNSRTSGKRLKRRQGWRCCWWKCRNGRTRAQRGRRQPRSGKPPGVGRPKGKPTRRLISGFGATLHGVLRTARERG